ncbi:hypothetical protein PINS_up002988 [Pythium insidiosum]|nr:hypothetical protein PINS_up002988 [Pythium insidiosum]
MAKRLRTTKDADTGAALPPVPATATASATATAVAPSAATAASSTATRPRVAAIAAAGKMRATASPVTTPSNGADAGATKHVMLPAFLSKTYEIFSMPEFSTVCGWNASGDTIIVSQLEAFVAMVLPRFFKHRNFPSFVRQLNLYGFHKTVLDSKRLEFQHPYFKRDRPDLLHLIKRKVSSNSGNNGTNNGQGNSRLEVHREISDQLLKEMKELRNRSDAMEKRLRELEIDNAIVRSDNAKLWKHLEAAKDKQLIMQEKMKKIMWILFQIYRGKQRIPKLGGHGQDEVISEDYINSSRLGPNEFRDVLRFLAMDEPPMLPGSSTATVDDSAMNGRKRKFVEVPVDTAEGSFGHELAKIGPSSVVEVSSPVIGNSNGRISRVVSPIVEPASSSSNVLSVFSPPISVPLLGQAAAPSSEAALSNGMTAPSIDPPTSFISPSPSSIPVSVPAEAAVPTSEEDDTTTSAAALDFMEDHLPLLSDTENYSFGDGEEQHVMKKLEDFESSLLDEYDVGCLDTLLQVCPWSRFSYDLSTATAHVELLKQLKTANMEKAAALTSTPLDPEEISVGPADKVAQGST